MHPTPSPLPPSLLMSAPEILEKSHLRQKAHRDMHDFCICRIYSAHYLSKRKKKAIRKITDYFNFFKITYLWKIQKVSNYVRLVHVDLIIFCPKETDILSPRHSFTIAPAKSASISSNTTK